MRRIALLAASLVLVVSVAVGQDVPAELYQVVAEILVAVHRAERQKSNLK